MRRDVLALAVSAAVAALVVVAFLRGRGEALTFEVVLRQVEEILAVPTEGC